MSETPMKPNGVIVFPVEESQQFTIKIDKPTIFVDLDGTCTIFRQENEEYQDINGNTKYFHYEDLFDEGYFSSLPENPNVVKAIRALERLGYNVAILSSYLPTSKFAINEKISWVREHISEKIPIYLTPCGTRKEDYFTLSGIGCALLLDDYTHNLSSWSQKPGFSGIKLLNGVNHTHKTWQGPFVNTEMSPNQLTHDVGNVLSEQVQARIRSPKERQ